MNLCELKEYLAHFMELSEEMQIELDRLESINDRLYHLSASLPNGMPKAPSPNPDRTGYLIELKEAAANRIAQIGKKQVEQARQIETWVEQLRNPKAKAVMRFRYLDGLPWSDVCFSLYGSQEDFTDKEESYMRSAYKLHKKALELIARQNEMPVEV